MNSLPSEFVPDQVVLLQTIFHTADEKYDFHRLKDETTEVNVGRYISQLVLSDIFDEEKRCYARHGDTAKIRIVDKTPHDLVNDIITAATDLLDETQGKGFWSSDGYIEPIELIMTAFFDIKSCDNQPLSCKENAFDPIPDDVPLFVLTTEQKELMDALEKAIMND